jgi:NAD(P)-dependent dehydrogenase (short-subunit alcohol dehydrogenase family)
MKNYLDKFILKNKKAFIFGGCGLLGKEIAEIFVAAGANTFVFDNDVSQGKKLERKFHKKKFEFIKANIADLKNIDINFKKFMKNFGCPDIFINCSYPVTKDWNKSSFTHNSLKSLRENVDMHLNSYAWWGYKICDQMKKKKIRGSVVLFSSIYGVLAQNMNIYRNTGMSENMNYSVIKGGITNFSKQLASYYGKNGIRVNAICPGGITGHIKGSKKKQSKKFVDNYSNQVPLKRLASSDEIAYAVLFLSSDASSYVTGTNFMVDGGWSAI